VIQRVAPDEDVIIDVGIKGGLRKQKTVRVGAGETKTITIDLAATETAAAASLGNDVELRYTIKSKEVTDAQYAMLLEANRKVPGTVPEVELQKLKLAVRKAALQIAVAKKNQTRVSQPTTAPEEAADSESVQPKFAALTVKYDIAESDKEAKILLQNIGVPNGDIRSVQRGMMRHTPVKKGESMQLNKLVPREYDVARSRDVELITQVGYENDPNGPRVTSSTRWTECNSHSEVARVSRSLSNARRDSE
jgi:hypothetical protein